MSYKRFGAMVGTFTAVMFCLMFATAYSAEHAWWSRRGSGWL